MCGESMGVGLDFYQSPLRCQVFGESVQHLTVHMQSFLFPTTVCFSFIHAKCTVQERESLWLDLLQDTPSEMPHVCMRCDC